MSFTLHIASTLYLPNSPWFLQKYVKFTLCKSNGSEFSCTLISYPTRGTPQVQFANIRKMVVSRPPSLLTSMRWPINGTSCPKSQLKSTCLTAKFGSFLDHAEMGEKGQNVISSSVQYPISLIFAIHVSFIIPLPMMWVLLTKPMQKSVITVCLHCSFARLKNKHMGVLGTM